MVAPFFGQKDNLTWNSSLWSIHQLILSVIRLSCQFSLVASINPTDLINYAV
jgi:hypothetical protein